MEDPWFLLLTNLHHIVRQSFQKIGAETAEKKVSFEKELELNITVVLFYTYYVVVTRYRRPPIKIIILLLQKRLSTSLRGLRPLWPNTAHDGGHPWQRMKTFLVFAHIFATELVLSRIVRCRLSSSILLYSQLYRKLLCSNVVT